MISGVWHPIAAMSRVSLAQAHSKGEIVTGIVAGAVNCRIECFPMAAAHLRSSGTAFRALQSVQVLAFFESVEHFAGWRRLAAARSPSWCSQDSSDAVQEKLGRNARHCSR